jgi:hypothetical protein
MTTTISAATTNNTLVTTGSYSFEGNTKFVEIQSGFINDTQTSISNNNGLGFDVGSTISYYALSSGESVVSLRNTTNDSIHLQSSVGTYNPYNITQRFGHGTVTSATVSFPTTTTVQAGTSSPHYTYYMGNPTYWDGHTYDYNYFNVNIITTTNSTTVSTPTGSITLPSPVIALLSCTVNPVTPWFGYCTFLTKAGIYSAEIQLTGYGPTMVSNAKMTKFWYNNNYYTLTASDVKQLSYNLNNLKTPLVSNTTVTSSSTFSQTRTIVLIRSIISLATSTMARVASRYKLVSTTSTVIASLASKKFYGALWSIIYSGSKFIGVKLGTNIGVTAIDGKSWTTQTLPTSSQWSSITTNGTITIAISNSGKVISTADGITWTQVTNMPGNYYWSSVVGHGSTFVAIALNSNVAATSTDGGVTWSSNALPLSANWTSICYGNSLFVAVCDGGSCASSSDGVSWTPHAMPDSIQYNCVTYVNGQFTAVASGPTQYAAKSSDGSTWLRVTMPKSANWRSVGPGYTTATIV